MSGLFHYYVNDIMSLIWSLWTVFIQIYFGSSGSSLQKVCKVAREDDYAAAGPTLFFSCITEIALWRITRCA